MAAGGQPGLPERLVLGPVTILVREDAASTGGAMTIFEELPPMVDTPLHVHSREDELFYALDGDPNCRPAERRVVPGVGHQLVVCAPAGFEAFFRDLAEAERDGRLGPDAYAAASERAGITWL